MSIAFVAALSTFVAMSAAGLWLARAGGGRGMDVRIRALAGSGGASQAGAPFARRMLAPAAESFGARLAGLLPGRWVRAVERRLIAAGQPMRPAVFMTLIATSAALLAGTYLVLLLVATSGAISLPALLPAFLFAAAGCYLPLFWLSSQVRARRRSILKDLPDSLDLLTLCVEAGLGLDAAFQQVVEKQSGPLADEIRQVLREVALGKTRRSALTDLGERTGIEDVRSFVNAVIQAEQLGTGVGRVLRAQGQHLRMRRRQRAEEEARRAPVKMVFPLVFCLMPSLFIFILGPIIVSIAEFISRS